MKWMVYIGALISLLMTGSLSAAASDSLSRTDTGADTIEVRHFRIYYPVNKVRIQRDYMDNARQLEVIRQYLAESPRIDSIVIYSYASPEGPYAFNRQLSQGRGASAKRYILSQVPKGRQFPDSLIHLRPEAENWRGLLEETRAHYHEADRDDVLAILESDIPDAQKKSRLQRLHGGRPWRHLIRHIMPHLRYATWISVWAPILPAIKQVPLATTAVQPVIPSATPRPVGMPQPYEQTRTILALKTNLLYDALSWLNFSVEVPFTIRGQHFSALYQHQFPWWTWGQADNEYCNRFLSIGGEARWWFRPMPRPATDRRIIRDRLVGWYVGLYGLSGKWDFERRRDICYQGEFWSTGLTVGYSMPIGRRLNLEFSLAAGYASIPYRGYTPTDDYEILLRDPDNHGRWHYFGPTRAEVTLSIPITVTRKGLLQKGGGL